MSPPKRAVIAVTSATAPLHDGKPTGLFIGEALEPFDVFVKAGFEVDLVSEKGTYVADWLSLQPDFLSGEYKKQWEDPNSDFRKKLDNMPDVKSVEGKNYGVFFASAGHAALIDYPHAAGVQKIGSDVWDNGGIVSATCHGAAIFPGIIDEHTGKSVAAGREFTGFTTHAEYDMHLMDVIRGWGEPLIDEWAEKIGGKYSRGKGDWDDYIVEDGRLISGMNPQSAKSSAEAAVRAYGRL